MRRAPHEMTEDEETCYAAAGRLTDPAAGPEASREGIRVALDAIRTWRAAPARLVPALTALLHTPDEMMLAATIAARARISCDPAT
ncbi:hypothetical protein [Actinoplanes sp. NPDC020271]|uniref:hypothetical protein n=1 Tax=Actinoplanes sp. NPDC020271 TaxID=3363896 RepID=UPI0037A25AF2